MGKKDLSYMAITVLVALVAASILWSQSKITSVWHDLDTASFVKAQPTPLADHDRTFQNDLYGFQLVVPKGWYLHERPDGSAILTKSRRLAMQKETEGWAIGEQITIAVSGLSSSSGKKLTPEKWTLANVSAKDMDDKPITKTWESSEGGKLLRVEQAAAGTSNRVLSYYLFHTNNVISFGLYPYDSANGANNSDFEEMVRSLSFNTNLLSIEPN
jgi:hypothetical protein